MLFLSSIPIWVVFSMLWYRGPVSNPIDFGKRVISYDPFGRLAGQPQRLRSHSFSQMGYHPIRLMLDSRSWDSGLRRHQNETLLSTFADSHLRGRPQPNRLGVHRARFPLRGSAVRNPRRREKRASQFGSKKRKECARVTLESAPCGRSHSVSLRDAALRASRCPETGRATRRRARRPSSELYRA